MNNDLVIISQVAHGNEHREIVADCKKCGGIRFVKNGKTSTGQQNYRCKACQTQSAFSPENLPASFAVLKILAKLLDLGVALPLLIKASGLSKWKLSTLKNKGNC